jgi:putative flippase GtrA
MGDRARLLRFLLVGVANAAFGYGVFALIVVLFGTPNIAVVVSTVLGVLFNFYSYGALVFTQRGGRFAPFVLVYSLLMLLNIACLNVLMWLGLPALVGSAILIMPLALAAYVLSSKYVYHP